MNPRYPLPHPSERRPRLVLKEPDDYRMMAEAMLTHAELLGATTDWLDQATLKAKARVLRARGELLYFDRLNRLSPSERRERLTIKPSSGE